MRCEALRRCEMGRSAWLPGARRLRRETDKQAFSAWSGVLGLSNLGKV